MPLQAQTGAQLITTTHTTERGGSQRTPKVYFVDNLPDFWVAEGTDGSLYRVPSQPGGWLHGDEYDGGKDALQPVSPNQARYIVWFTYGDMGPVKIAED